MKKKLVISFLVTVFVLSGGVFYVSAENSTSEEINDLNQEIEQKQSSIDQLNRQIETYREKIEEKQQEEATLYGELDILDNRIAKTELDIEATEAEIDLVNTEISVIEVEVHNLEELIDRDRELIIKILQDIEVSDNTMPIQLFLETDSFSEFFSNLEQLEIVSSDLKDTVDSAKISKELMLEKHEKSQSKKDQLEQLSESLAQERLQLDASVGAKSTLLTLTQQSEAQFQEMLSELKQEEAYVNQQIAYLQREVEGKLDESDALGDSSLMSWPFDPSAYGISAYFHDPTYPFRHLFEHSGIDLPAPVGTPVQSVAPGYIAWTKEGRLYGNYIMVIHSNGFATLYAHLSRIDVTADQFVARGDTIGAVGNTGFSTGPHLHFEVRKDGIPTNPLDYLIAF